MTLRFGACYNASVSPKISPARVTPLYKTGHQILRLNVGFILKEGIGFSRDFPFDESAVQIADDLLVNDLRGVVNFTRTPQGLYAKGRLFAKLHSECVRCLDAFDLRVTSRFSELFVYPPENAPEGAFTVGDDIHVDLAPLVREDMLLSVPMQTLCRPDCQGLCPQCGQNWNEGACNCRDDEIDPRMAALAQLLKGDR